MTLIDRLRATRDVPVVQRSICAMPRTLISVVDKVYINPDGPEAAAALEAALEALEPFARELKWWKPTVDDTALIPGTTLRVGDLRKARAAIAKVKEV